ncbi:MAG: Sel1 repeat protein [Verrucomicrobiales bacterium]|jgi:TPR repeat protein|nr:Sel1 repeat protein [Verrucomicrobiales bacterium]
MIKAWFANMFSGSPPKQNLGTILDRATNGEADAQFALGLKFSSGEQPDLPQAAQWYRKAALQNHLLAQFNLSIMLARGQGIGQNDTEAAAWLSRAAYAGDPGAQFQMGNRLSRADLHHSEAEANEAMIEAYKWFQLAGAQGYKGSVANSERITFRMSHHDVSEGNQRVSTFVATLA